MKKRTILFTLATLFAGVLVCFAAGDVNMGTWKLNEAKSKFAPGASKSNTVVYEAVGDNVKATVDGTDGNGKPTHNEWSGKFDGKDNPVKGDPNRDTAALSKIDDYSIQITSKKAGKVVSTIRAVFSRDGKTRTQTGQGTNAQGVKTSNTVVYEK